MLSLLRLYFIRPHDTIHPLNITNIHNIDLIPATPPQYLLNPVNIYEFLLPPRYLPTPTTLYSLISSNSSNLHPISNILLPPLISANPHYLLLIPTFPLISTNSANPHPISNIRHPHSPPFIPATPH